jgi:predicted Zn finger-like uncharacterized protein
MLIVCPHCQARYEFPAEQMGGEVLRVRCSACGHVATLLPDGSTQNPTPQARGVDDDAPALSGYSVIQKRSRAPQAAPPVVSAPPPAVMPSGLPEDPDAFAVAPRAPAPAWEETDSLPPDPLADFGPPAAPDEPAISLPPTAPRDPRRNPNAPSTLRTLDDEPVPLSSPPKPNPVSIGGRDERDLEIEPSIIIDMESIGDETPPPAPAAPARAAPPPDPARRLDASVSDLALDIPTVPRRSVGRFFFSVLVFGVAGLVFFVWARNDFGDVFKDPARAVGRAFGTAPITAPPTRPPVVVEPPAAEGRIEITEVALQALPKRGSGLLLRGRVKNATTVKQGAITLRAMLLKDSLPLRERTVPCCDDLDLAAAQAVAQTPNHAHLSAKMNNLGAVQLGPGESRPFSIVFPDAGDLAPAALVPLVEVKFSEIVRTP